MIFTRNGHFLIFLCLIFQFATTFQKLDVDILYESLCPDSLKFIRDQLYPSWKELEPYINIRFVPFGKSQSINGGESFECQHGPEECSRNKLMSCALQRIYDQTIQVEYVTCAMTSFRKNDPLGYGQQCVPKAGIQWSDVIQCYSSNLGTSLQLEAEQETLAIKPNFIPTILYNKKFNQELQDNSLVNFKGVVCSLTPNACLNQRS